MKIIKKLHYKHLIIEFEKIKFDGISWCIYLDGKYIGVLMEEKGNLRYTTSKIIGIDKYVYFNVEVKKDEFI